MKRIPIYVASRASVPERPAMWRRLRSEGWNITSSWIDEAGEGETASFSELWWRITKEINDSAGVILFANASDFPLKGALVECGIALGMGKRVAVVVDCMLDRSYRPVGSWVAHPLVTLCQDVDQARAEIESQFHPMETAK